jgi:hypothetical protein
MAVCILMAIPIPIVAKGGQKRGFLAAAKVSVAHTYPSLLHALSLLLLKAQWSR